MSESDSSTPAVPAKREKIAILGGGIAALTTAFELTQQADWQSKYDICLYQMGWRLGGKCATQRGPHDRIEEHGIHGFLGSYYNALPLMARCYEALGRPADAPLSSFEKAFLPESFVLMWEYENGQFKRWPFTAATNSLKPQEPASLERLVSIEHWLQALIGNLSNLLHLGEQAHHPVLSEHVKTGQALLARLGESIGTNVAAHETHHSILSDLGDWLSAKMRGFLADHDELRRLYILIDYMLALVRGVVADDIVHKGFDSIDDENFSDWLARHGASTLTISSPLALNTVNLSYQYPQGDTARSPCMAAGTYLHWTLRSFAYMGAFAWLFAAGTGETVIAPLYEVLRKRGVRFEFFHKVENLQLSQDGSQVQTVHIGVQATLQNPSQPYEPLIDVQGLPSWPTGPRYEQLVQGQALREQGIDLESYWTPWQNVAQKQLQAGVDFDRIVMAISIGAIPYLCDDIVKAKPAWQEMVSKVTTVQTQTMQLWLKRTTPELGWDIPLKNPTDTVIGATYLNPLDGQVDFSHLLPWESWPKEIEPKSLWYFSGAMADYEAPPPFSDTQYPARQHARVKAQCIQYLQVSMGPLLPKSTTHVISPPGDPVGLDFSLLQAYEPAREKPGVGAFDQQFWRANIDPSERYVTSPPGSTAARLKAWGSGLSNLVLAGDWIYTGLNVGSVEGAVMGGRLASHALSGWPLLTDIVGYPQS